MLHSDTISKVIYSTSSFIQSLLLLLFRILYISIAAIALFHYNDNPTITIIVAAICILFFAITGSDKIVVYTDSIRYIDGTFFKTFKRNKEFNISDLESFEVNGDYNTADELYSKPISWQTKPLNKIMIKFKDGRSDTFQTSIYRNKLNRVADEVSSLIVKRK